MRRPMIAGNWKMNTTAAEAEALVSGLLSHVKDVADLDIIVAPPFVYLQQVAALLAGGPVALSAQNMSPEKSGAWTGEVSGAMLKDVGCTYVIIGHSERRQFFSETDEGVNKKIHAALGEGLRPIVCVGESLAERKEGVTLQLISGQVKKGMAGVPAERAEEITIAYEPIWAIGTGETATPDQAEEVHAAIRGVLTELFGGEKAEKIRILYGGSVKPDNVDELMARPNIDGALVGGASLTAESFARIVGFRPIS